jgi:hypothetical protein
MSDFVIEVERVGARWIGKVIRSHRAKEIGTPQKPIESADAMLVAVREAIAELDPAALAEPAPMTIAPPAPVPDEQPEPRLRRGRH